MTEKTALITGITGQDGAYLARLLLEKGYRVHGIKRRSSSFNTPRIDEIYEDPHVTDPKLTLHYGDLTDSTNLIRVVQVTQPDEIYNLAAQSHVAVSFETPEYTANSDALGTLRLLEAIRILKLEELVRVSHIDENGKDDIVNRFGLETEDGGRIKVQLNVMTQDRLTRQSSRQEHDIIKHKQQIETRNRVMDYKLQQQKEIYEMRARGEVIVDPAEDGRGNEDIYNPSNMP